MSATKPQVAASAGLGPSSGGECCPPEPPGIPWPAQPPTRSVPCSPGGCGGQRRGGTRGMESRGLGLRGGRPGFPPASGNWGSAGGNGDRSPNPPSPGLEPSVHGGGDDARPLPKFFYSKPRSGFWGCKDGGAAPLPAWNPGRWLRWGPPANSLFPAPACRPPGTETKDPFPFPPL